MTRATFRAWAPVIAWAAVIFAFSSIPSLGTGLGLWDLVLRKLAHITEYAILGVLLFRATKAPAAAVVIGVLYAVSDEVHQHFVRGRHAAWYDVVIDTVGVTIGVLASVRWRRAGSCFVLRPGLDGSCTRRRDERWRMRSDMGSLHGLWPAARSAGPCCR